MKGWRLLLFAVSIVTAARTLGPPLDYAVGHWLLDWRHGFVPRGLVGTLLLPLWRLKSPDEITWAIDTLALGVLAALLWVYAGILERLPRLPALALAASPWVVFAGHTVGYLDQVVDLAVVGAVMGAATGRPWAALLLAPAVATHELAVFFLPLVWAVGQPRDVAWSVPALAVFALLTWNVRTLDPALLPQMEADLRATGVLDDHRAPQLMKHLRDAMGPIGIPPDIALRSATRLDVLQAALPVSLLAWVGIARDNTRGRAAVLILASLAPMGLHLVGWDAARFTLMVPFAAALAWAAKATPGRGTGIAVLGGAVFAWNLVVDVPLMQREVDGGGLLWPRAAPEAQSWKGCKDAFANAGFEAGDLAGWEGEGFVVRTGDAPGVRGRAFATSLAAQGARGTGRLQSPRFPLRAGELLVAVHGEVRLVTGRGERVARGDGEGLEGVAWTIPPGEAGTEAWIVAEDRDPAGFVSLDGVCWFER